MGAGLLGSPQQLMHAEGSAWRTILWVEAMLASLLTEMFAHELSSFGIEEANKHAIPLHVHGAPNPTRGRAVVGGIDFDAAIQVHRAWAELVIAERLDSCGSGNKAGFSSTNMAATCRLVVPWIRVSAQLVSQRSK